MNWYFEEHGVIKGPFPEPDFVEMVRRDEFPADTLVWRPGLEEWATVSEVNPPWLKNIAISGSGPAKQQAPAPTKGQAPAPTPTPAKEQAPAAAKGQTQAQAPAKEQAPAPVAAAVAAPAKEQVSTLAKGQVSAPTKEPVTSPPKLQVLAPSSENVSGSSKEQAPGAPKQTSSAKDSLPVIESAIPNQAAASSPARTTGQPKFKPMAPIPSDEDPNRPVEKGGLLKRVFGIGGKQKS